MQVYAKGKHFGYRRRHTQIKPFRFESSSSLFLNSTMNYMCHFKLALKFMTEWTCRHITRKWYVYIQVHNMLHVKGVEGSLITAQDLRKMTKLTPLQSRNLTKAYLQTAGFPSHKITFSAADSRQHAVFAKNSNVSYKVRNPLFSEYVPSN